MEDWLYTKTKPFLRLRNGHNVKKRESLRHRKLTAQFFAIVAQSSWWNNSFRHSIIFSVSVGSLREVSGVFVKGIRHGVANDADISIT